MEIIRRVFSRNARTFNKYTVKRNIATTSVRPQESMEELQINPYYEKYAAKIAKLQRTSPEEFLSRIETQQKQKEENASKEANRQQFSSLLTPKKELTSQVDDDARDEPLDKIMKVELVENKDANEITRIWQEYHIHKDVIAAAVPASEYDLICEQAKKYPLFIFPLPRSQGYEFIVSEFRQNSIHFTPLICYQVHKENAPECLTIKHYVEFKDSKGLVLMRGEFDENVIDVKEAQCLANQLQLYYGQRYLEKTELLRRFSTKPDEFKHVDLIKQIEALSL